MLTPQIRYLARWLFCVERARLQGRKCRARKFCCLAWPCRPARCREEGLALGVVLGHPLQAPFQGVLGQEAPGPTGSLWKHESTCDLECEGPAKGITMRNATRHSSLMCLDLGMGVRRHTEKPDGIFQGHGPPWRAAQRPFSCPFPSPSAPGRLGWEHKRPGDTRLMASEAGGQPPTRPVTILR